MGPGKLDLEILDFELVPVGAFFIDFMLSVDIIGDVVFWVGEVVFHLELVL